MINKKIYKKKFQPMSIKTFITEVYLLKYYFEATSYINDANRQPIFNQLNSMLYNVDIIVL